MDPYRTLSIALLLTSLALAGCKLPGGNGPVPPELLTSRHYSQEGVAAMERADWSQAEGMLAKAVKACPNDAEARRHYAEALWHRGAREAAVAQMEQAVRIAGDDAGLHVRLAQMRLELGAVGPAHAEVELALNLDPKMPLAWATRGQVMRASGNLHEALADYHRALGYAPEDRQTLLEIAELHRLLDEPSRAIVSLQALADTYTPGEEPQQVFYLLGLAQSAMGRNDDAVESFSTALLRGQPNPELLAQLGESQRRAGRLDEAAAAAHEALALDPQNRPGLDLLSRIDTARRGGATTMR
jgi:tetratricopeptide (TPR) repeat protein